MWWFVPVDTLKTTSRSRTLSKSLEPEEELDDQSENDILHVSKKKENDTEREGDELLSLNPFSFLKTFRTIDWTNLWDIFAVKFLLGFAVIVYRNNFSLMLDYRFQTSTVMTGYITSFTAIIGTISGLFVGKIAKFYKNEETLMLHVSILQFFTIVGISVAPNIWMLVAFLTPLSLANAIGRVATTNLTVERGHGQDTGVLMGLSASVLSMARMISPTVGGIAQEYHVSGPAIVGAVFAASAVMLMLLVRYNDDKVKSKKD